MSLSAWAHVMVFVLVVWQSLPGGVLHDRVTVAMTFQNPKGKAVADDKRAPHEHGDETHDPSSLVDDASRDQVDRTGTTRMDVLQMIERERRRIERLSTTEQEAELSRRLQDVNRMTREVVVGAAAAVAKAAGIDDSRAYAPRKGVEGPFEVESSVLYDITMRVEEDGQTVYVWTMVDRAGRSITSELPPEMMTPADMIAFRLFEMGRQNPNMGPLLDAARKMGHQKLESSDADRR